MERPTFQSRMDQVAGFADRVFAEVYGARSLPDEIVHVTCTGYEAPSAAQRFVCQLDRQIHKPIRVTHAYHMGCAAAVPALGIVCGKLAQSADMKIDVVHTESCTAHADATRSNPERIVIESLFADGAIAYSLQREMPTGDSYEVLGTLENILPGTGTLMQWNQSELGFEMTLARQLPQKISEVVGGFVGRLLEKTGLRTSDARQAAFAIHPGGPAIIDRVRDALGLNAEQVALSSEVLRLHGNLSSATLPTIWERMLPTIPAGTPVVSLAFAPGLTLAGAVLRRA